MYCLHMRQMGNTATATTTTNNSNKPSVARLLCLPTHCLRKDWQHHINLVVDVTRQIKCSQLLFREQLLILPETFRSITLLSSIAVNSQPQHLSCPISRRDPLWVSGSGSMVTTSP